MKKLQVFCLFVLVVGLSSSLAHAGTIKGKANIKGNADKQQVIVYVSGVKGNFSLPAQRPEMNHIDTQFVPSVLPILKGTTVDFPNSDPVFHSAFSTSPTNPFDLGLYGRGKEKFWTFEKAGVTELFCHIHSHMHAYILVLDNPYFATTADDGSFEIAGIPNGSYTLRAWLNPAIEIAKDIEIEGNKTVNFDFTLTASR